jgi:hypothetical protein
MLSRTSKFLKMIRYTVLFFSLIITLFLYFPILLNTSQYFDQVRSGLATDAASSRFENISYHSSQPYRHYSSSSIGQTILPQMVTPSDYSVRNYAARPSVSSFSATESSPFALKVYTSSHQTNSTSSGWNVGVPSSRSTFSRASGQNNSGQESGISFPVKSFSFYASQPLRLSPDLQSQLLISSSSALDDFGPMRTEQDPGDDPIGPPLPVGSGGAILLVFLFGYALHVRKRGKNG